MNLKEGISNVKDTASLLKNLHVSRKNPVSVVHFITNRCNARCSFCFIDFDNKVTQRAQMSIEEIDTLTKNMGPNLQNVNITGGEPFARADILEIARCYFNNTNVRSIYITTNGSFPDRLEKFLLAISTEFPDRKILLQFSIDAMPEEHNRIRKVKNLFERTMKSYVLTKKFGPNVQGNIVITVSHENHGLVFDLYEYLITKHNVQAITLGIVRDEGVYRIPIDEKRAIFNAYKLLSEKILEDLRANRLKGWDKNTVQGRMMNKKNAIMYSVMDQIFMEPKYLTPCRAGSIFGVIEADGTVKACEVLDKNIGNLKDYNFDFLKLWYDRPAQDLRKWISDTKCNCHYDCAWSFNILANKEYQVPLLLSALGKDV